MLRRAGLAALGVLLASCVAPNPYAEQAMAAARDHLDYLNNLAPETPHCFFAFASTDGYVHNIFQSFSHADLQLGDRVVAFDGERAPSDVDLFKKVMAAHKPGDHVVATVERSDRTLELDFTCGDGAPFFRMRRMALAAILEQDWEKCISTVSTMRMVYPFEPPRSSDLSIALACVRAESHGAFVYPDQARRNAGFAFDYGKALLSEARYVPYRRNRAEAEVEQIIQALDHSGNGSLASELQADWASAAPSRAPRAPRA